MAPLLSPLPDFCSVSNMVFTTSSTAAFAAASAAAFFTSSLPVVAA
ncbi:MAG: hypothetical protein LBP75_02855 [Planctomycetota bacterium]|nr:hypothetical protein [Planctomycetota bacterium]